MASKWRPYFRCKRGSAAHWQFCEYDNLQVGVDDDSSVMACMRYWFETSTRNISEIADTYTALQQIVNIHYTPKA